MNQPETNLIPPSPSSDRIKQVIEAQLEIPLVGEDPVLAWKRITGSAERVLGAELVKKGKRTRVYRLAVQGRPCGVIAKRCREKVAVLERAMYTQILDKGPLRAPAYYGFGADPVTEDEHRYFWVFVEDLGPRRHDPSSEQERRGLAQWLGTLHANTVGASPSQFPDVPLRHSAYYRDFLHEAITGLTQLPANRQLPLSVREVIDHAVSNLERVESRWAWIEPLVGSAPTVIAHGDCLPKNIHVTDGEVVVPIDWGSVGVGIPGADLGVSSIWFGGGCEVEPAVETYVAAIRPAWPDANASMVKQLAYAGRTLWVSKLLAQSLPGFQGCTKITLESHIRLYGSLLERSAGALLQ